MDSKIKKIRKRDGRIIDFNSEKIVEAIWKAAKAVGGKDREKPKELTKLVVKLLEKKFDGRIPSVEEVQDVVEKILIEEGHAKTAKAYILYRKSHQELREIRALFDSIEIIEDYVSLLDWRVKENANMAYSLQGLNNYVSSRIIASYWLKRIYSEEIRKAHEETGFHIHDLGTLGAYCVGWDLKDLLMVGFTGVPGKVQSKPPKHFRTALGQVVNFFYTLQGEAAGAQACSNFDTLLAPFIKYDNLDYKQVKQDMQEFIYNMAVPTRVGFQCPFTNITLDLKVPEHMKNEPIIIGGKLQKETFGEFQKEMNMFNRAFAEIMMEGDANGRIFTFPIPTYNITKDFDWDNPNYDLIWEMASKYGIPYFSNFVNSDMKPEDSRSMCCRLRLSTRDLKKRGGGLFGANPLTGSIGVVTINLPIIGYESQNEKQFFKRLGELMDLAKESLIIKRTTLERFTDAGLYPYSRFYLRNIKKGFNEYWKNHFSTIGLVGMNEAIINLFEGENILTEKGRKFAEKILDFMRDRLGIYQEETGEIFNLEATPAEGSTYRFAKHNKLKYPDIIVANNKAVERGAKPYFTNSSQLPVDFEIDLFEALKNQDSMQTKYTGGTVFHTFVGERLNKHMVKILIKKITEKFKLPYFTITPTFSVCPEHNYIFGEHPFCPKCKKEEKTTVCEVYTRIVGYIRPLSQWNLGKAEEFKDRIKFKIKPEKKLIEA